MVVVVVFSVVLDVAMLNAGMVVELILVVVGNMLVVVNVTFVISPDSFGALLEFTKIMDTTTMRTENKPAIIDNVFLFLCGFSFEGFWAGAYDWLNVDGPDVVLSLGFGLVWTSILARNSALSSLITI